MAITSNARLPTCKKCDDFGCYTRQKLFNQIGCSYDQPERSKREDFCLTKLAEQYLDEWELHPTQYANIQEAYMNGVYDFSDWLKQRCGALSTDESQ